MRRFECRTQLSSFWDGCSAQRVLMKMMPRLMCPSDHEGSSDANEEPVTVSVVHVGRSCSSLTATCAL